MGWKQSGYGIHPFQGTKAPHIDAGYDNNDTVLTVRIEKKLKGKELETFCESLYQAGKDFLNLPILSRQKATASNFNLEQMILVNQELQESFLKQFSGVEVRQDLILTANKWYCAVSPEIFKELKAQQALKGE